MIDTKYTEKQYAIQLFDFAAERQELKYGSVYFIECRKELLQLVNEQCNAANFWHDRWRELCEEVMTVAGLPTDFKTAGTGKAFDIIREAVSKARTT